MDTKGGREEVGGIGIDIYTRLCIKWITNENLLHRELYSALYGDLEGWDEGCVRDTQEGGNLCNLWLIHVVVHQKPTQD